MSASDIREVRDPADPSLDVFRDLKDRTLKEREGRFIAEGVEAVRHLLASGLQVVSLFATPQRIERLEDCLPAGFPVFVAERSVMEAVVGFPINRGGVMACSVRPPAIDLDAAIKHGCPDRCKLCVVLDGISDAQNVGLILRSAVAFGAGAALLVNCCDPFYRRVVRVSMGAVFRIALSECEDTAAAIRQLRERHGFATIATAVSQGAVSVRTISPAERTALVFGSEGAGLSQPIIEACDRCVSIPMSPGSDSVNVAVAAGIFLYHFAAPAHHVAAPVAPAPRGRGGTRST